MAILKIARMGHPVLSRIAAPVEDPKAPDLARLVADMTDTLADIGGVGLAAPKVHVSQRLDIFHVPPGRNAEDRGEAVPLTVLINPEIEPLGDDQATAFEGCLSVPDMMGAVPRWTKIRYRGVGLDGEVIDRVAEGFHARVVQHECDHLIGKLYPMRVRDFTKFGFTTTRSAGRPPSMNLPRQNSFSAI